LRERRPLSAKQLTTQPRFEEQIMAVRPILTYPHPLLSQPCQEVTQFDDALCALVADLTDTMRAAPGVGITAAHIGVMSRVFVLELTPGKLETYINAQITSFSSHSAKHTEGSVSLPGMTDEVERPAEISLTYQDVTGKAQSLKADGFLATCIQHEIDQLDGIFWIKRLSRLKRERLMKKWEKQQRP
jgi:peptide deformylase